MEKKTILVVEDEIELNGLINKKLNESGFVTMSVKTTQEALDILNSKKIDLVWLDHYLSGDKCGLDLVCDMKEKGKSFSQIPIFVVSNTAGPEEKAAYIEFGVDNYYVKTNSTLNKIIDDIKLLFSEE